MAASGRRGAYIGSPRETARFVCDPIDRGPKNARVLEIARAMVEAGQARVAMGNHELNALHFATLDDDVRPSCLNTGSIPSSGTLVTVEQSTEPGTPQHRPISTSSNWARHDQDVA